MTNELKNNYRWISLLHIRNKLAKLRKVEHVSIRDVLKVYHMVELRMINKYGISPDDNIILTSYFDNDEWYQENADEDNFLDSNFPKYINGSLETDNLEAYCSPALVNCLDESLKVIKDIDEWIETVVKKNDE